MTSEISEPMPMSMQKPHIFVLIPALIGLLLLAGCGGSVPNADEAAKENILLFGNGTEPKSLDPHIATGVTENNIISALMEGLVAYHPTDDNKPYPGVAESWEPNENYSEWTFHLREDAKWSNGDPVTAQDFVYGFKRMLHPDWPGEYAQMLYLINGAQEFKERKIEDFLQVDVEAVDKHTLRIGLVGPTSYFPNMLKHYSWFPVHKETLDANGGMLDRSGQWTRVGNHVGNGPFILTEWKPNQYIKVERNPQYWDNATTRLNAIYFFPIEDHNTEKRMFDSGKLHITQTVPQGQVPSLKENPDVPLHIDPYLGTYFYRLNVEKEPLDNPKVRRALGLAIDRQAIVNRVTLGGQQPAHAFVPSGFSDHEHPDNQLKFDPEAARKLLAEAGYPDGEDFPELELLFNTSEGHRKIAEAVGQMWKDNLGINITLDNAEWKVYLDRQSHRDYQVTRSSWIGDYMDPITFLDMWTTGNGNNDTGWSNTRYDQLIDDARRAPTPEAHAQALEKAEAVLMEELPIIPIYYYTRIYLKDPRLKGWNPKLLDNRPYKTVWLEAEE